MPPLPLEPEPLPLEPEPLPLEPEPLPLEPLPLEPEPLPEPPLPELPPSSAAARVIRPSDPPLLPEPHSSTAKAAKPRHSFSSLRLMCLDPMFKSVRLPPCRLVDT